MVRVNEPVDISRRHPSVQNLHRRFAWSHLPTERAKRVSRHFAISADLLLEWLPDTEELTVCLRKLLEAKDCAVRAALDLPDTDG